MGPRSFLPALIRSQASRRVVWFQIQMLGPGMGVVFVPCVALYLEYSSVALSTLAFILRRTVSNSDSAFPFIIVPSGTVLLLYPSPRLTGPHRGGDFCLVRSQNIMPGNKTRIPVPTPPVPPAPPTPSVTIDNDTDHTILIISPEEGIVLKALKPGRSFSVPDAVIRPITEIRIIRDVRGEADCKCSTVTIRNGATTTFGVFDPLVNGPADPVEVTPGMPLTLQDKIVTQTARFCAPIVIIEILRGPSSPTIPYTAEFNQALDAQGSGRYLFPQTPPVTFIATADDREPITGIIDGGINNRGGVLTLRDVKIPGRVPLTVDHIVLTRLGALTYASGEVKLSLSQNIGTVIAVLSAISADPLTVRVTLDFSIVPIVP